MRALCRAHIERGPPWAGLDVLQLSAVRYFGASEEELVAVDFFFLPPWCFLGVVVDELEEAEELSDEDGGVSAANTGPATRRNARTGTSFLSTSDLQ